MKIMTKIVYIESMFILLNLDLYGQVCLSFITENTTIKSLVII